MRTRGVDPGPTQRDLTHESSGPSETSGDMNENYGPPHPTPPTTRGRRDVQGLFRHTVRLRSLLRNRRRTGRGWTDGKNVRTQGSLFPGRCRWWVEKEDFWGTGGIRPRRETGDQHPVSGSLVCLYPTLPGLTLLSRPGCGETPSGVLRSLGPRVHRWASLCRKGLLPCHLTEEGPRERTLQVQKGPRPPL